MHIYDSRFPAAPGATLRPPDASVDDYRLLQKRIGTTRNVVVTPSTYGTDNRCTLDALGKLGPGARGVAVVDTSVSDAELKRLADSGIRGIRFNLAVGAVTTIDMIEPLAKRVQALNWHVQINMPPDQLAGSQEMLTRLPTPIVFDHMARLPVSGDIEREPAFIAVRRLLDGGRCWVKLSGAYINSKIGPPTYGDAGQLASALIRAAPERIVWGSDWPHPTHQKHLPDDAMLFDLLVQWADSDSRLRRILVTNPQELYGFPP
jgi:predicted TIM-barrel fold metal-dependent hydrolase